MKDPNGLHIGLITPPYTRPMQYGTKHTLGPATLTIQHIYTHNTPSNSRWINSLEFGQKKGMLIMCLSFGEKDCNLDLRGKIVEGDHLIINTTPCKVSIHADMFGQLMLDQIGGNLKCPNVVTVKRSGGAIDAQRS